MKHLTLLFVLGFICSTGFALAAPSATPPLVHAINQRQKTQWQLTQAGVKSGKLTKAQAQTIRVSLRKIRLQEFTFFKENKNHTLTTDQINQLNQSLNENSSVVGETPVTSN